MKYSELQGIFAEEQTSRGLLVIGIDRTGRQVEVLFQVTNQFKADWDAIQIRYL